MKDRLFVEKRGSVGKDFINSLYILFKTALIHDLKNVALNSTVDKVIEFIHLLLEEDESFSLKMVQEHLFIDEVKIKVDIENFLASMFFIEEMKKRGIGWIRSSTHLYRDER